MAQPLPHAAIRPYTVPHAPCADLCLYPREKWKEQGWDLVDSMDPHQELEGFSYADIPDPAKGEAG